MNIYDESCYNLSWGYFDIPGGENVLYVDGVPVAYADYPSIGMSGGLYCSFTTVFTNVPMDGDYYEVGMSSGRRGRVSNSRAEMESNGWEFDLSLGL